MKRTTQRHRGATGSFARRLRTLLVVLTVISTTAALDGTGDFPWGVGTLSLTPTIPVAIALSAAPDPAAPPDPTPVDFPSSRGT